MSYHVGEGMLRLLGNGAVDNILHSFLDALLIEILLGLHTKKLRTFIGKGHHPATTSLIDSTLYLPL